MDAKKEAIEPRNVEVRKNGLLLGVCKEGSAWDLDAMFCAASRTQGYERWIDGVLQPLGYNGPEPDAQPPAPKTTTPEIKMGPPLRGSGLSGGDPVSLATDRFEAEERERMFGSAPPSEPEKPAPAETATETTVGETLTPEQRVVKAIIDDTEAGRCVWSTQRHGTATATWRGLPVTITGPDDPMLLVNGTVIAVDILDFGEVLHEARAAAIGRALETGSPVWMVLPWR